MTENPTIHASAILVGAKAVLISGPAGSGKSRLVWELLQAAVQGALSFARLVADDRVHVEACAGRLLVRPAPALAGMLEIRGLGIRRLPYEVGGGGRPGRGSDRRGRHPASGSGDRKNQYWRGLPAAADGCTRHVRLGHGAGVPRDSPRGQLTLGGHLG